ncbi:hypothetical protein ACLOJK_019819 [Asimina triloba]
MGGRAIPNLSFPSKTFLSRSFLFSFSKSHSPSKLPSPPFKSSRLFSSPPFKFTALRPTRCFSTAAPTVDPELDLQPIRRSLLLDKLRIRHLRDSAKNTQPQKTPAASKPAGDERSDGENEKKKKSAAGTFSTFWELGIGEEVMGAVDEVGISTPTEIQCLGIPAVLKGTSVVLGSHTGSGKTLAYLLPLVQVCAATSTGGVGNLLLRRDESLYGMPMKPRRPRAVVLCPTRELCEQVFRVSKSISHHARFRSIMVSGGGRLRPQEDSLNVPIDMVVGTPGRVLQHIEEENMVYGDIRYLVLDEADTMFDQGFGPDIRKFLGPLKKRTMKPDDPGFQTILVTATMTKDDLLCFKFIVRLAVQKLVDEEFQGIVHLRTSTLHKKIASARHDFIKLSGAENKLESLLQVLEPSLSKGNRVMVFCNTLNSSRAVDHFLTENQISTVNYHGEVPAEQRVENLKKFKSDDGDCPTLVCTDLAARGLDLDVDHVIMFDFPLNSIDYLHRTGRTARMGAKAIVPLSKACPIAGKVTSLVAKKDLLLATRIEEAIRKNESLESLTVDNARRDVAKAQMNGVKRKNTTPVAKASTQKGKGRSALTKSSKASGKTVKATSHKTSSVTKTGKISAQTKPKKTVTLSKPLKSSMSNSRKESSSAKKHTENRKSNSLKSSTKKLDVVGFRGRSSSMKKQSS